MRYAFQEHYLIHPLIMRVEIALKFIYQILLVLVYILVEETHSKCADKYIIII